MRVRLPAVLREIGRYPAPIWAIFAGWVIGILGRAMIIPFLALFFHNTLKISMATVATIYLLMGVARTVGRLASGFVIDHLGCRRVLYIPPLLRACAFFGLAWCVHVRAPVWVMVALLCATDFLRAFFSSASDTYVADVTPAEDRPHVYGFLRIGLNLGWMIGPAIGAFLARTPFSLLFALTGGCVLLLSPLTFLLCPETRHDARHKIHKHDGALGIFGFRDVWRNKTFTAHCLFSICHFVLTAQLVSTLSVYAINVIGITRVQLGWTYTLNGLLVIVFQIPVNAWLARVSLGRRLVVAAAVYACGYFAIAFVPNWSWLLVTILLISFSEMAAEPAVVTVVSRLAPQALLGRFMGVYGFARETGYSLGQYYGGWLYHGFSAWPAVLWGGAAAFGLVAAAGFAALRKPVLREEGGRHA
ncbi:MAG: MFS transporter [Kiritimatiellae bacterium]|nr:MFS transporter [Kiritimatiellia bacterium]